MTGTLVYTETFAAATRFDTVDPVIRWTDLRANWAGRVMTYTTIAVLSDTLPALTQVLGPAGSVVAGVATVDELVERAWQDRTTAVILPFEQLVPRLAVLAIDGQTPIENVNHFDPSRYPLVAATYARVNATDSADQALAEQVLAALPTGNRDPNKLTVIAMTGVTAMCRQTAAQMDRLGPAWPAEVVGPELASADITHISNEVPFVPTCVANTDPDNFNFCSKPEYMATLEASGADIIGLTGNHQNDFGRENANVSLDIYEKAGLPLYGGGRNKEAAFTPLVITHNGNRLAFLGANSYGPKMAWATDTEPGAAEFDLAMLSYLIRQLKEEDKADVVLAELQYQESYDTQPLADQRQDFERAHPGRGRHRDRGPEPRTPGHGVPRRPADPLRPGESLFRPDVGSGHARGDDSQAHDLRRPPHRHTGVDDAPLRLWTATLDDARPARQYSGPSLCEQSLVTCQI